MLKTPTTKITQHPRVLKGECKKNLKKGQFQSQDRWRKKGDRQKLTAISLKSTPPVWKACLKIN